MNKNNILPWSIRIEACSLCQLNCPCCPNTRGLLDVKGLKVLASNNTVSKEDDYLNPWSTHAGMMGAGCIGKGYLKAANFKKLIDNNPWIRHVELSNWGEIFLNPELVNIIEYAYKKNIMLTAENGVNLNTVNEDILEALVKYNFSILTISIDGATNETYKIYRVGGDLDTVMANIKKINFFKGKYASGLPVLVWKFTVFGHNENEIRKAKEMAAALKMKFMLQFNFSDTYSPIKDADAVRKLVRGSFYSRKDYFNKKRRLSNQSAVCSQLWNSPQINWDGRLLGCCINYWDDFKANAFEGNLTDALNGPAINHARDALLGNKRLGNDISCSGCIYYKIMSESGNWLKKREIYLCDLKSRIKYYMIYLFKGLCLPPKHWA